MENHFPLSQEVRYIFRVSFAEVGNINRATNRSDSLNPALRVDRELGLDWMLILSSKTGALRVSDSDSDESLKL